MILSLTSTNLCKKPNKQIREGDGKRSVATTRLPLMNKITILSLMNKITILTTIDEQVPQGIFSSFYYLI